MIGVFGKMAKELFYKKSYKLMILYRNVKSITSDIVIYIFNVIPSLIVP